jgi:hypothetical protein
MKKEKAKSNLGILEHGSSGLRDIFDIFFEHKMVECIVQQQAE